MVFRYLITIFGDPRFVHTLYLDYCTYFGDGSKMSLVADSRIWHPSFDYCYQLKQTHQPLFSTKHYNGNDFLERIYNITFWGKRVPKIWCTNKNWRPLRLIFKKYDNFPKKCYENFSRTCFQLPPNFHTKFHPKISRGFPKSM